MCGNNSGIAVGMGSDLVSHNFTEVSQAIKYYIEHQDCSIVDLMQFIKGPDFPTGGMIINGEELLEIYTRGSGSVKMHAHYDITKQGQKTLLVFHDLPYGVEIDDGIKKPLKKLVLEDGYDVFEDISVQKVGDRQFDISILLGKGANVAKCLELLFNKTKLASSIKINQNVIVDGEPRLLNLKQMVEYWVKYRSHCISRIAQNDYQKTNHKLTVTIGLQKCMSDIDKLVNLIRQATDRNAAKRAIITAFELNDEQAEAVLDMKLSRLSKLDLEALNNDEKELTETLAKIKTIIEDEKVRFEIILKDLDEIKKVIGKDERLTEIHYSRPAVTADTPAIKQEFRVTSYGIDSDSVGNSILSNTLDIVYAYSPEDIVGYNKDGELTPINAAKDIVGAFVKNKKDKFITVTKNGNIKVSFANEYKFSRANEKALKLKEDDELIYADFCADNDFIMLFDGEKVLKLSIAELSIASKLTVGVKSGLSPILAATVVNNSDMLLFVTKDLKGKYTSVQDFSTDSRGNKGQQIAEDTICMRRFDKERECIYLIPKTGNGFSVAKNKITVKGRTAIGATLTSRAVVRIL